MNSIINDPKNKKICEVILLEIMKVLKIYSRIEIGKGDYSKVYKIMYNGNVFALKIQIYKQNESTKKIRKIIEKEINLIVSF